MERECHNSSSRVSPNHQSDRMNSEVSDENRKDDKFGEEEKMAIFVETTLGTRIVLMVPINITSIEFKRKLEKAHKSCLGEIQVNGLMVKQKSQFYYLTESLPIKYIFLDNKKPWFIHAEATLVNTSQDQPIISNDKVKNSPKTSRSLLSTPKSESVGETISKKLMVDANNIRMQGKSRMSSSLSQSILKWKRSLDAKTLTSLSKFMVFEIPDTED